MRYIKCSSFPLTSSIKQTSYPSINLTESLNQLKTFNMKFQLSLIALIASATASPTALVARQYGGPATTGEVCPQAQDLWYLTKNQYYYQIGCEVEATGDTAIAVYADVSNVLDCAQYAPFLRPI
jgi:hypothetical protein